MARAGYERGHSIDLPPWYVEEIIKAASDSGLSQKVLAERAAKAVGRREPWDQSAVTRFLKREVVTSQMAQGLARVFHLPPPIFIARSSEEARRLNSIARQFDAPTESVNPDTARRLRVADDVLEDNAEVEADHTDSVTSGDERTTRGGRTGRAPRGRTPPARS